MAKMVGYACSVRLQWLNKAAELLTYNMDTDSYKDALNEYLSYEIDSETRLRKTREILMHVWYYSDDILNNFRENGLQIIQNDPDNANLVHLCLLYLAYPVVADICKYTGKLFEYQDEITTQMLKQKLYDEWGERGTLETTARRVTLTLKELGFLSVENRTRYSAIKKEVKDIEVINFMLATAMSVDGSSYYPFSSLKDFPFMFPFEYRVTKEQLMQDKRFKFSMFDATLSVALG